MGQGLCFKLQMVGAQVDLLGKGAEQRLDLLQAKLCSIATFDKVYRMSAMKGIGVSELRADLISRRARGACSHMGCVLSCRCSHSCCKSAMPLAETSIWLGHLLRSAQLYQRGACCGQSQDAFTGLWLLRLSHRKCCNRATPGAWAVAATQHTDKTPLDMAQEVRANMHRIHGPALECPSARVPMTCTLSEVWQ